MLCMSMCCIGVIGVCMQYMYVVIVFNVVY